MQLDLFESKNGHLKLATIHAFPLDKRASLVRETAAKLMSMSKAKGRKFWSELATDLSKEISQFGAQEVERQLNGFTAAVRSQIVGFGASGPEKGPRGSARVANICNHERGKSA